MHDFIVTDVMNTVIIIIIIVSPTTIADYSANNRHSKIAALIS